MQDASYIERFIEKDFHDWKDNWADSKTLLVKGGRQVGKTTSVRHFAAENYKYVIYVDVRSETDLSLLESASESNVVEIGLPQSLHKMSHEIISENQVIVSE
uniref:AAA family ATPase n=1 Tax=Agathobacter sp. TaxID=2021311 RepID=UPI003FEE6A8E